jgi:hypothetical protein
MDVWQYEASLSPQAPQMPTDRVFEHYLFGSLDDTEEAKKPLSLKPLSPKPLIPKPPASVQPPKSEVKFESFKTGGKIDFVTKLPPEFETFDLSVPDGSLDFVSAPIPVDVFRPPNCARFADFGNARVSRA